MINPQRNNVGDCFKDSQGPKRGPQREVGNVCTFSKTGKLHSGIAGEKDKH